MAESLQGARRHAGALLPLIERLLARIDARVNDVSLVAVGDGPGSFTGIRVAFAAAKALAAEGATLVTAPSLLVRAAGLIDSNRLIVSSSHRLERVLGVSAALRGEVYAGLWRFDLPRGIDVIMEPRTLGLRDVDTLPPFDRAVGDGPEDILSAVRAERRWPEASVLLGLIDVPGATRPVLSPQDFEPHYGRPAEAAAKWEREHGRPLPDSPGNPG